MGDRRLNGWDQGLRATLALMFLITLATGGSAVVQGALMVPGSEAVEASIDNEFRFLATSWLGYGLFCMWVALDPAGRRGFVPSLALVPIVGAVARGVSIFQVGAPTPEYVAAIWIELVFGVAMLGLAWMGRRE